MRRVHMNSIKFIACSVTLSLLQPIFANTDLDGELHNQFHAQLQKILDEQYERNNTPQDQRFTVQQLREQEKAKHANAKPAQLPSAKITTPHQKVRSKVNQLDGKQLTTMLTTLGDAYHKDGALAHVNETARNCYRTVKAGGNPPMQELRSAVKTLTSEEAMNRINSCCIVDLIDEIFRLIDQQGCGANVISITQTEIDLAGPNGFFIPAPGYYCLAGDITFNSAVPGAAAININGLDFVDINLAGHSIDLQGSAAQGVSISDSSNVLIHDGTILNAINAFAIGVTDSTNITVDSLYATLCAVGIRFFTSSQSSSNENCTVSNSIFSQNGYGVIVSGASRGTTRALVIEDCFFSDNTNFGIQLFQTNECLIERCSSYFNSVLVFAFNATQIIINDCASNNDFAGYYFQNSSRIILNNCQSVGTIYGILSFTADDLLIHNGMLSPIQLNGGSNIIIDTCEVINTDAEACIELSEINGAIIRNCTLYPFSSPVVYGIALLDSQNIVQSDCNVFGNNVIDMYLNNCSAVTLSNCLFANEPVDRFGPSLGTNLFVYNSSQVWVNNCDCSYAKVITDPRTGIVTGENIAIFASNYVQIDHCVTYSSDNLSSGITMGRVGLEVANCSVIDSIISKAGNRGIYLIGDSNGIFNCQINDNGNDGITIANGTTNSSAQGNKLFNNTGFGINDLNLGTDPTNIFYSNVAYNNAGGSYNGLPAASAALQTTPFPGMGVLANVEA